MEWSFSLLVVVQLAAMRKPYFIRPGFFFGNYYFYFAVWETGIQKEIRDGILTVFFVFFCSFLNFNLSFKINTGHLMFDGVV